MSFSQPSKDVLNTRGFLESEADNIYMIGPDRFTSSSDYYHEGLVFIA